jgi:hypothetical protein
VIFGRTRHQLAESLKQVLVDLGLTVVAPGVEQSFLPKAEEAVDDADRRRRNAAQGLGDAMGSPASVVEENDLDAVAEGGVAALVAKTLKPSPDLAMQAQYNACVHVEGLLSRVSVKHAVAFSGGLCT